jgi:membrane protein DedA with SNARE-associated domain
MEREYMRFGIAGIFISRLLPGFRSFVAPFAGLANLSPAKTLIPIAAAATLWYGFLVYVGVSWVRNGRRSTASSPVSIAPLRSSAACCWWDWFSGCCSAAGALGMTDCGAGSRKLWRGPARR